jgi:signal transduction histidine kinase
MARLLLNLKKRSDDVKRKGESTSNGRDRSVPTARNRQLGGLQARVQPLDRGWSISLPVRAEQVSLEKLVVAQRVTVHGRSREDAWRGPKVVTAPRGSRQQATRAYSRLADLLNRPDWRRSVLPYAPVVVGALSLGLLATQRSELAAEPVVLAALAVAGLVLALLPIWLPGQALPVSTLLLALVPTWLLSGAWATAALAVASQSIATSRPGRSRLPLVWQLDGSLAGVALGALLGTVAGAPFGVGLPSNVVRAIGFALGLWGGQSLVEWLSPQRETARPSWLVCLLTNLILVLPGVFLAEIGTEPDPIPFVASLGLAVGLVILIRASTNSETRSAEVAAEAASTAHARDHLELIVDQAPEAIFGMDQDGTLRWLNRTAADWLGDRADEVVGQEAGVAVPVRTADGGQLDHARLLGRAAEEGRPLHEEGRLEGAPGAPERVLASYSAAGNGAVGELGLVLLRDASVVTESLREQEELAVQLSHELRAPLTTILGYAQLMASPNSSEVVPNAQTEFARRISESGDYMLRLVNNLLDLGRLARDEDEAFLMAQAELTELTREVVEAHRPQADAKAQELRLEAPAAPIRLFTAELGVRQILTNLVANAIKYTPPKGHIRVSLYDSWDTVTWQVADDGIGLSAEEQDRLFTKFFRSQRPEARLIKGTGLGLALTKALVERLGGAITVESTVDRGSTFTVELPRQRPTSNV